MASIHTFRLIEQNTCLFLKGHPKQINSFLRPHRVSAKSFSTKGEKSSLKLLTQSFAIPHPRKAHKGGEDAFFVSANGFGIGVADGVGGWEEVGVDPSLYSRNLMACTKMAVDKPSIMHEAHITDARQLEPVDVLTHGYQASLSIRGSSTACIVLLHPDKSQIRCANLGDSGFMLVRQGKVVHRSREQVKGFNFPYQLGAESPDIPRDAFVNTLDVQEGDIVVVGSDGLFDNMYDHDVLFALETAIAQVIQAPLPSPPKPTKLMHHKGEPVTPESEPVVKPTLMNSENLSKLIDSISNTKTSTNIAEYIAQQAHLRAKSKTTQSPFAKTALENGIWYVGGKMDDITVVVSIITKNGQNQQSEHPTGKDVQTPQSKL